MASLSKSTSKRQKATMVDRISNLPDSLLSHILSFLTIKKCVATSILSSRWKLVWTLVPIVEFDANEFEWISSSSDEEQSPNQHQDQSYRFRFAHIVSRFCALRNGNPIQKFRLHWRSRDCDPIHVDTWIRATIACGLEELDLAICSGPSGHPFYLPCTLFSYSKTLVVLKLSGYNIVVNPPSSSLNFPSVKILHLQLVKYANHDSFSSLLRCCPVLQDLSVIADWRPTFRNDSFKIIVPTLKRLNLKMNYELYKLVINAPALEYLSFSGLLDKHVFLENLSNLVEAVLNVVINYNNINNIKDNGNRVLDFIRALYSVKSLHLSAETTKCLCNASGFDTPMFHNLAFLNFSVDSCMWHVLPLFLERTPNLAVLILDKGKRTIQYALDECSITHEWIRLLDVPPCLLLHLSAFHFKGFEGFNDELELVREILKWARVLKKMTISSYPLDSEKKVCVLKQLLMFPRRSVTCEIAFNCDES